VGLPVKSSFILEIVEFEIIRKVTYISKLYSISLKKETALGTENMNAHDIPNQAK
jgi:hypothetical protein